MNEVNCVFAKAESLVEVPYTESSFWKDFNVKFMIPSSYGIRINDMNNVMCYMNYDMCYLMLAK